MTVTGHANICPPGVLGGGGFQVTTVMCDVRAGLAQFTSR